MKHFKCILHYTLLPVIIIWCVFIPMQANAGMVEYETTKLVKSEHDYWDSVILESNGTYRVSITDFYLAGSLEEISLDVMNNQGNHQGDIFGEGHMEFNANEGIYHLELSISGAEPIGLVGITLERIDVTPVPLPAPFILLFSALVFLSSLVKYRGRQKLRIN